MFVYWLNMPKLFVKVGLILLAFSTISVYAQTKRILFLVDASGSMAEKWGSKSKYEIAISTLANIMDSIIRTDKDVEFALRLYGHQSPKPEQNCEDTKLELPFGKHSKEKVLALVKKYTPQGWTPIAYSLLQAMSDFPDYEGHNSIILITDGEETCEGDPCAVVLELQKRRISFKPFVIGMGVPKEMAEKLKCIGYYRQANSRSDFEVVVSSTVKQVLNRTTVQVNLLNAAGEPVETDVAITFLDAFTHEPKYHFVHTLVNGLPDTLEIDPTGKYDVIVHTVPPKRKDDIELVPGRHNIIAVKTPQGSLTISMKSSLANQYRCIIRDKDHKKTLFIQEMNSTVKYLAGTYDIEILTLPPIRYDNYKIKAGAKHTIDVPAPGIVDLMPKRNYIVSIFTIKDGKPYEKVIEWETLDRDVSIALLPGKYVLVYRPLTTYSADQTRTKQFAVPKGQKVTVTF